MYGVCDVTPPQRQPLYHPSNYCLKTRPLGRVVVGAADHQKAAQSGLSGEGLEGKLGTVLDFVTNLWHYGRMTFNQQHAIDSLVQIRSEHPLIGMGFMAEDGRLVTAGHCLPLCPETADPHADLSVVAWVRRFQPKGQWENARVVFNDSRSDIAALELSPSSNLNIQSVRYSLLRGRPEPFDVHIFTHLAKWITGSCRILKKDDRRIFITLDDKDDRIEDGTSGAPAFDDTGKVIGVVSASAEDHPECDLIRLAMALPLWLLESEIQNWPF